MTVSEAWRETQTCPPNRVDDIVAGGGDRGCDLCEWVHHVRAGQTLQHWIGRQYRGSSASHSCRGKSPDACVHMLCRARRCRSGYTTHRPRASRRAREHQVANQILDLSAVNFGMAVRRVLRDDPQPNVFVQETTQLTFHSPDNFRKVQELSTFRNSAANRSRLIAKLRRASVHVSLCAPTETIEFVAELSTTESDSGLIVPIARRYCARSKALGSGQFR
jgi:hypothetical protein